MGGRPYGIQKRGRQQDDAALGTSKSSLGACEQTNFMTGRFRLLIASLDFDTLACFPYRLNLATAQCMQWRNLKEPTR
jgi:hypothetical protein